MRASVSIETHCWVCGCPRVSLKRTGVASAELQPADFAITSSSYGRIADLYECAECGFLFCPTVGDATPYYEALEDSVYEDTRLHRGVQADHLLKAIGRHMPAGRFMDVGAGTGVLVERAAAKGYDAMGVEPGKWLAEKAKAHGARVACARFPDPAFPPPFDVITAIDVLEHINTPVDLLRDIARNLSPEGIAVIATPDVNSLAARLMGRRWWNYRIGHIGYFNRRTLTRAFREAGLEIFEWRRQWWYFPLDFVLERVGVYLPFLRRFARHPGAKRINVPLNFFDSWIVFARKSSARL